MVLDACGPREAGSSETPNLLDNVVLLRKPCQHVLVPGQRPEAEFVVAVERGLVAQALVVRVRVFVEVVVVRVEQQVAGIDGLRCHGRLPR